jgi:biotin transporter BioY
VGLPVFAASATLPPGALRLIGPTGGYLLAYPVAALLVGALAEEHPSDGGSTQRHARCQRRRSRPARRQR